MRVLASSMRDFLEANFRGFAHLTDYTPPALQFTSPRERVAAIWYRWSAVNPALFEQTDLVLAARYTILEQAVRRFRFGDPNSTSTWSGAESYRILQIHDFRHFDVYSHMGSRLRHMRDMQSMLEKCYPGFVFQTEILGLDWFSHFFINETIARLPGFSKWQGGWHSNASLEDMEKRLPEMCLAFISEYGVANPDANTREHGTEIASSSMSFGAPASTAQPGRQNQQQPAEAAKIPSFFACKPPPPQSKHVARHHAIHAHGQVYQRVVRILDRYLKEPLDAGGSPPDPQVEGFTTNSDSDTIILTPSVTSCDGADATSDTPETTGCSPHNQRHGTDTNPVDFMQEAESLDLGSQKTTRSERLWQFLRGETLSTETAGFSPFGPAGTVPDRATEHGSRKRKLENWTHYTKGEGNAVVEVDRRH
ncbi:hypothetical protein VTI74DRAFT_1033 [Chaetomium olivicolor]